MGLRNRAVIIFFSAILISVFLAVLVSWYFYLGSSGAVETSEAEDAAARVLSLMWDDLDQLDVLVKDWAYWDDLYRYVLTGNPDFVSSNLSSPTFESLGLSSFFLLNGENRGLYAYVSRAGIAPEAWTEFLGSTAALAEVGGRGFFRFDDGLHLAAIRPILRSDGSGLPVGLLAMTRPLDLGRLERYSRLLGVGVSLSALMTPFDPGTRIERGKDDIAVWRSLQDIVGNPVGTLVVRIPRGFYRFGEYTFIRYILCVSLVLGCIAAAAILTLQKTVLRSLQAVASQLGCVRAGECPSITVPIPYGDEIGILVETMNSTLDALNFRIRERDVMLREIHHRVKNNLQIIASLLSLQSAEAGEETVRALDNGRRRILAMSLVYNELYDARDLSRVSLGELLRHMTDSFAPDEAEYNGSISLDVRSEEIHLDIDRAIPLGLIVSELLSNAYRHGFPRGAAGRIEISARKEPNGGFLLEVRDNGTGIPKEKIHKDKGLGLSIVDALASQLGGSAIVAPAPGGGTLCALSIPAPRG